MDFVSSLLGAAGRELNPLTGIVLVWQWSRLLAHTPLSSANSRKDFAKDPARRLHRFEKEYSQLLVSMLWPRNI